MQREKVITYMPTHHWKNEDAQENFTMEILCFWCTCSVRDVRCERIFVCRNDASSSLLHILSVD